MKHSYKKTKLLQAIALTIFYRAYCEKIKDLVIDNDFFQVFPEIFYPYKNRYIDNSEDNNLLDLIVIFNKENYKRKADSNNLTQKRIKKNKMIAEEKAINHKVRESSNLNKNLYKI